MAFSDDKLDATKLKLLYELENERGVSQEQSKQNLKF
jgi:hypothetical protein